jgi:hypothetical protein
MEFRLQFQPFPAVTTVEQLEFLDKPLALSRSRVVPIALASIFAVLIHGYHPYSQDATIYLPGIERLLDPSLFRSDAPFIDCHAKLSIFAPLMAAGVHLLHVPLDVLLAIAYVVSIVAFIAGCSRLAAFLFDSPWARWSGALMAASCLTLPAAGTSLLIMDPYVTARSISTPASLFAILACLKRSWGRTVLFEVITIAAHPLMGAYLAAFLIVLTLLDHHRVLTAFAVCGFGLLCAGILRNLSMATSVSDAYREAVFSRNYYLLSGWQWYEVFGLIAPILLMFRVWRKHQLSSPARKLCAACVLAGLTALLISLCFVHANPPDLLMRIQVLRIFHVIYLVGIVLTGGYLGARYWESRPWVVGSVVALSAAAMFAGARASYPSSEHFQLVFDSAGTPQEQALLWIRNNTPADAVFASSFDANRALEHEDIGFRAFTRRSILTDEKDEGVASLVPAVADDWASRRDVQLGMDEMTDAQIESNLAPYGVNWLLLSADTRTSFECPYRNALVAVCRMGQ